MVILGIIGTSGVKYLAIIVFVVLFLNCNQQKAQNPNPSHQGSANASKVPTYGIKVVKAMVHDSTAFTQGLFYLDGVFYEGTGLNGHSTLRKVDVETGKILKKMELNDIYFGEGIAALDNKIYQLTWINHTCLVYDLATFRKTGTFDYDGEGWGLTTDGKSLIMSDGTNIIRFISPQNFEVIRTIGVTDGGIAVANLNELEVINGEIWANIWQSKKAAIINPQNGNITAWIDLSSLYDLLEYNDYPDVLNGIAYDSINNRIYVTGKLWKRVYQIELVGK